MRNVFYGIVFLLVAGILVSAAPAATTPADEYNARLAKTNQKDPASIYDLAKWMSTRFATNRDMLKRAKLHLDKALKLDPNYRRAQYLIKGIDAKLKKLGTATPANGSKTPTTTAEGSGDPLVTEKQINAIRLAEFPQGESISKRDKTVRMKYLRENGDRRGKTALDRYVAKMIEKGLDGWDNPKKKAAFLRQPKYKQLQDMIYNLAQDQDLLQDVQIISDPDFMVQFRTKVWPVVRKSCASKSCHGGTKVTKGPLFTDSTRTREMYTNFLMVSAYLTTNNKRLVDRQSPHKSLLLQFGLPTKDVDFHHPAVKTPSKAIKPLFTSKVDPRYRAIASWIESLNGPLPPSYHIEYVAPRGIKLDLTGEGVFATPSKKPAEPVKK
ncbi:MAG: hypothetical protein HN370_06900 [Phycisphaerales bacterium]|jgi:hypothetical protein|nr:hypothetical protein [Phycisphaerales bacterium]